MTRLAAGRGLRRRRAVRRRARPASAGDTGAAGAGLGVALSLTAVVFRPWLVIAGIVPLGWGAWTWLRGARDELDATAASASAAQAGPRTSRATSEDA